MRKLLTRLAIVIVFMVTMSILWIFSGRHISLFLDRFGTIEIVSTPINWISYEGTGSGGILSVNNLALSLNTPNPIGASPDIGTIKDGQVALSFRGKVFVFGPPKSSESDNLTAERPAADDASISTRRSAITWPTPFDFNFMTGHSPSWKRHLYYRLTWKKQNGAKLDVLWRYEQYFYPTDGWASGFMMNEDSTGLIRVDIEN